MTRDQAFWARLVGEVEAGESILSVAKRHRVTPSWLGKWRRRLKQPSDKGALTLLPVRLANPTRQVHIQVGAQRVVVDEGTDPTYVAALCRALSP